ncbi:MAG: pyruvate kinase [Gammaproteobacteria bacterium]
MAIVTQIDLLKKRRTKIVATLGPASATPEMIKQLILAGANVFRLNMSHGDHDSHRKTYAHIRALSEEMKLPIGILADLCGPKIRTGKFRDGEILLTSGTEVTVTTRDVEGEPGLIPSQYTALNTDVTPGNRILLNDGLMELRVISIKATEILCQVIHGGILKNHKGINLPGVNVSAPSLTEKDRKDAAFALELGVDFLALSFVRRAADIGDLRKIIHDSGNSTSIIAKIEKPEALADIEQIVDAADAIMVARGDLGVELNPEEVPVAQSQLIDQARANFKPVIVATQMLESMIESARPTRAEVTDIAHAVTLGADAVMLSAETASGKFPLESVQMMDRIARQTESHLWKNHSYGTRIVKSSSTPLPIWDVMANATAYISKDIMAHAIVVISASGMSAATMSSARPSAPVVAITSREDVFRRIALLWGVIPVYSSNAGKINPNDVARDAALELGLAAPGEYILLVRGFHSKPELNIPSITCLMIP